MNLLAHICLRPGLTKMIQTGETAPGLFSDPIFPYEAVIGCLARRPFITPTSKCMDGMKWVVPMGLVLLTLLAGATSMLLNGSFAYFPLCC